MKLTSLELLGFKSFLNRTTFRFSEGITCIVGPNGCGKSNIVDAMTWVLGERGTKSLRVKEMGDVIFHGSGSKKQVNVAEVTIGLAQAEREYAIRRRIYRDGTNEYYINNDPVRLKDVQDFLLGTGVGLHTYAIIEQGNIEYFTQMKPQERRIVVEETSGITRFEEKKRDAFLRMEEARASLERVEDIHREVAKSHEKVEEEAGRLKIYNELRERLREIDIALLVDGFTRLRRKELKLQEREELLASEVDAKEAQRRAAKERMAAKDEEISLIDTISRKIEIDIKDKEKDMESRLLEINYTEEEKKRLETTSKDLQNEFAALSEKIKNHESEVVRLRASAEQERQSLQEINAEGKNLEVGREELRKAQERLEKEGEDGRNRLFAVMTRLTEIRNGILERERIQKEREARRQRRIEEERSLTERLRDLEENLSLLEGRRDAERIDKTRLEKEEKKLVDQIEAVSNETSRLRNSLEGLKGVKKGKEDVFRQLKSYGESPKREAAPYKQLINILKASKDSEEAMEKFFPKEMEYHVLTETDPYNLAIIAREYGENFVFFPPKGMFDLHQGEADVKLQPVSDLPEAFRRITAGEEGFFLAGNILVDSRGLIRKGGNGKALSIQEFRKRMKLETELAEIDEQLKEISTRLNGLQPSQKDTEKSLQGVRGRKQAKESAISEVDRDIIETTAQIRIVRERLDTAAEPVPGLGEDPQSAEEASVAEKKACEDEKSVVERSLADLRIELQEVKARHERTDSDYHKITIAIERGKNQLRKNEEEASAKKGAIESFLAEKSLKQEKAALIEKDLARAAGKAGELERSYASLREECGSLVGRYEEMKRKLGDLRMEKVSIQEERDALDREIEKTRSRKEGLDKERLVVTEKKAAITDRLKSDYGVENIEDVSVREAPDDAERERMFRELSALGEVNFRAEKERTELKERLEFLDKQKNDLAQAIDSLKKTIAKIDSVSQELFLETFERVNEAFKRFTYTLFKGGQGTLTLNRETNGIELYVQPPGKKVIRMELLSGGEKALISLSFLLSLMDTKASPFTLMDEIDAPLDDANLLSLLEIVKMISGKTQMILITHNRMTMEASNTIYGITMEQDGISKTISIRL